MFCKKCGKEIKEGAKFCISCGTKVEYVNVQVNNNVVDEFELEKQKIARQEQEERLRQEAEKREEEKKQKLKERKQNLSKLYKNLATIAIILAICVITIFSIVSLIKEFNDNQLIYDGKDVMLKIDGNLQKNVRINVKGKSYYLGADGRPQLYRLALIGEKTKAQDDKGEYVKNKTINIDGNFYHFDDDGDALKNELYDDSFFDSDGKMIISNWNGDYYFGEDGKMRRNEWIDIYYVGSDGRYLKSQWTPDDFFVDDSGKKVFNKTIVTGGKYYYIGADGKKIINDWVLVGNDYIHTDNNGVLYARKKFLENGKYYYFKPDGIMLKGAFMDGHYADETGALVVGRAIGYNYFNNEGDMVVDTWIGNNYYDMTGTQVINGWAQEYYLQNGAIVYNSWVDNDMYYVGADGVYLRNTYVNGCELGYDGKWTGKIDYGININYGSSHSYDYTGNRYSIKRKFFDDEDEDSSSSDDEYYQSVAVARINSISSNTNALTSAQLINMKNALNNRLSQLFDKYKSEVRSNYNIELIDADEVYVSSQSYNVIRFRVSVSKRTFTGSKRADPTYITYNVSNNTATIS